MANRELAMIVFIRHRCGELRIYIEEYILYTLILPTNMYLGRCRSSNNAHFMWLIETLVFPV
jgi:hypothetical protein